MQGELTPQGAKNEALQIICASLLTTEPVTVHNIPDILDVNNLVQLLREMGVEVSRDGLDTYTFRAAHLDMDYMQSDAFITRCAALRGSVMLMGPLLAREGYVRMPRPGGDKIGRRRLDTHFLGMQKLGAAISCAAGAAVYEVKAGKLQGTYMLLAAAAGGKIVLKGAPLEQLRAVRQVLKQMGVRQESQGRELFLWCPGRSRGGLAVCTSPYPGFPTDLQSPLMAALCLAAGESVIEERIFESRFKIAEELARMGADIRIQGFRAEIRGVEGLRGGRLKARELRGGAALCIAAAAAEGTSRIYQYHYIARGYENIIRDLKGLGVVVH